MIKEKIDEVITKMCDEINAGGGVRKDEKIKALAELVTARAMLEEKMITLH